jgi:hypothetical protein
VSANGGGALRGRSVAVTVISREKVLRGTGLLTDFPHRVQDNLVEHTKVLRSDPLVPPLRWTIAGVVVAAGMLSTSSAVPSTGYSTGGLRAAVTPSRLAASSSAPARADPTAPRIALTFADAKLRSAPGSYRRRAAFVQQNSIPTMQASRAMYCQRASAVSPMGIMADPVDYDAGIVCQRCCQTTTLSPPTDVGRFSRARRHRWELSANQGGPTTGPACTLQADFEAAGDGPRADRAYRSLMATRSTRLEAR